jgi:uncharacterized protein
MPEYLSPGVYVENVPGTPAIAGVGTSTAAFIGELTPGDTDMPLQPDGVTPYTPVAVNEPQFITNWGQFETKFGKISTGNNVLAHAIYGFFNNGGARCYVVRASDMTATNVRTALATLDAIDEVAIVAAPGATTDTVQTEVVNHCENLKDRFAILDGNVTTTISVASIKGSVSNSEFAAMYFPRIQVLDPASGSNIYVHPSGHMAGIYARVDNERGVHKAPANEVVRGALGLEYLVSKGEQDVLNPDGINAIRRLHGSFKVWGARTLGGDANGEFKYVNVRRLMNFIAESIDEGTQFAVFEPNAHPLWKRITRSVSAFLTLVWRDGALFGTVPEEAFFVRCDESTNPPAVREAGQVVTEIGVAIVKPAEFVIFRISQLAGPASE